MAVATALAIGAGISAIGGAVAANQADKAGKRAGRAANRAQAEIDRIKNSRVTLTNPYAGNQNLSSLAQDLSAMITNPFANLSVATQAAEIQMEQSDMALANSLDNLAASGASAGRAQGESKMEQMQMQEAQRLQGVQIAEGQRMQSQQAAGNQFVQQMRENRSTQDLNAAAGQKQQAMANQASAAQAQAQAWGGAISGVTGMIGAAAPGL